MRELLANIEILTLEISNNLWTDFIGMFEDLAHQRRADCEFCINGI